MKHYLSIFKDTVRTKWEKPAVSDYNGATYTFAQIATDIKRIHAIFAGLGVQPGDKVAIAAKNSAHWAIAFLATACYRAVVVPILNDFLPADIATLTDHSESVVLFTESKMWENMPLESMPKLQAAVNTDDFSALYSRYTGSTYSDVITQVYNVCRYMRDDKTGLYYHGMDCSREVFWADKETGLSKNFWLRSIGWYAVALVDLIDIIPSSESGELVDIFVSLMNAILAFRDEESGMYWQVPNMPAREGNYLETSGSSMLAYAMLKGARLGVLEPRFADLGRGTFEGICQRHLTFDEDGTLGLGGICLVAGLGPAGNTRRDGSYEYYVSEPVVENDAKGVAPFILAYTEILRGE